MKKEIKVLNDCRGMFNEDIIESIFKGRDIKDIELFMNPTLEDMYHYSYLYRIEEAVEIIVECLNSSKKILVQADVDTDGLTSGSSMIRYLRMLDANVDYTINSGKLHGTSDILLNKINECHPDVLIIVDSLDSNIENYKFIYEKGIKTIVLDHHDISRDLENEYDKYTVLVSSNRRYPNKELSGVGVVFKFLQALDDALNVDYSGEFIDLVCCGMIADMMSMDESHMENRAIVRYGLETLINPALKKIVGGYNFNSTSVSFSVAPLLNAAVRYNENETALNLLLAEDNKEVLKNLRVLKDCKKRQGEDVAIMMPDLLKQLETQVNKNIKVVFIETEFGISGLIGNKLLDIVKKPVLVLKKDGDTYFGSMRSIGAGDFRELLESTGICKASGHAEACGVEIKCNDLDKLIGIVDEKLSHIEFKVEEVVDVEVNVEDINNELIKKVMNIDRISGYSFPQITFKITIDNYEVTDMSNGKHLVLKTPYLTFIKWNFNGDWDELTDAELCGSKIECIGTLQAGYIGRNYYDQMIINDYIITD